MAQRTIFASISERASMDGQYLTFALGREEYGLEIMKVREIIGYMEITQIPQARDYVRGVINLRGQVIGVIDLRTRFGMAAIDPTEQTCIIVVEIQFGAGCLSIGIIVDRVLEVLDIGADQIEPAPALGKHGETDFILGMGKLGDRVKLLLDIDKVLTEGELTEIAEQKQE